MDTTIAATIATAMAGAIAALWKHTATVANRTENRLTTKLDECEKKHGAAQTAMVALSTRVGQLEGQMEGYTQARNDMKALPDEIVKRLCFSAHGTAIVLTPHSLQKLRGILATRMV